MYTLLMIDDEDIVRAGFSELVDWAAEGFVFLDPCGTSRQALAVLETLRPDVVIVDSRMPLVEGQNIANHVETAFPGTILVLLIGYEELQITPVVPDCRTHFRLFKPVTPDDICALLARLREKLKSDQINRQRIAVMQQLIGQLFDGTVSDPAGEVAEMTETWFSAVHIEVYSHQERNFSGGDLLRMQAQMAELAAQAFVPEEEGESGTRVFLVDQTTSPMKEFSSWMRGTRLLAFEAGPSGSAVLEQATRRMKLVADSLRASGFCTVAAVGQGGAGLKGARRSMEEAMVLVRQRLL